MDCETIVTALTVLPVGESIFHEHATTVELEDEGGGLYVVVTQDVGGKVAIDVKEWPHLRRAIDKMIAVCVRRNAPPLAISPQIQAGPNE